MAAYLRDMGRVMTCPKCHSACRENSIYFRRNDGQCVPCGVAFVPDSHAPRVARRRNLYVVVDP